MAKALNRHLENNSLYSDKQHGYRRKRSTATALIQLQQLRQFCSFWYSHTFNSPGETQTLWGWWRSDQLVQLIPQGQISVLWAWREEINNHQDSSRSVPGERARAIIVYPVYKLHSGSWRWSLPALPLCRWHKCKNHINWKQCSKPSQNSTESSRDADLHERSSLEV